MHPAPQAPPTPESPASAAPPTPRPTLADPGAAAAVLERDLHPPGASTLPSGRTDYRRPADVTADLDLLVSRRPDLARPLVLPHRTPLGGELAQRHGRDQRVTDLLDRVRVVVVPVVNPDGYAVSRDLEVEGKRRSCPANADFGVDLNRDYGVGWGGPGSSGLPTIEDYRGAPRRSPSPRRATSVTSCRRTRSPAWSPCTPTPR